ncbi:hypothetical protein GNX60_12315 [Staphylococcus sp. 170179]|uniref:hypothetical protein n=1 Tax=Staphylococcus borealis TaxID=2742203 RepID=UPI0012E2B46E|nr:hypothetical protein [Staphylococcus borealis]HCX2122086.1 hypothetical protein [Staphylococcus aureus]HDH6438636.1 hypothetical protein [Staphylococcus aureus MRSA-Lux-28]MUN95111.1 hypothetical protein [Staphylococcus borealis]HEH1075833.1 hypothetical protein [Staphylococcus aureus]HEI1339753.1 hypothetical protein [Staphylococcus aureus]
MNTLNTVMLCIGLFFVIPSMIYLTIYYIVNTIVLYQKSKTKTSISTNIYGVKEIKYNVSPRLLRIQTKLKENRVFGAIGFVFGLFMIDIPLLYILLEFLKDFLPSLNI